MYLFFYIREPIPGFEMVHPAALAQYFILEKMFIFPILVLKIGSWRYPSKKTEGMHRKTDMG